MEEKRLPGTPLLFGEKREPFAVFRRIAEAAGGLSLSQICALTGLESSTVQNWVKRGWVARPVNKKYGERQLSRILIISALRDSLQLEQIADLLAFVNGSTEDVSDDIVEEARLYDDFCGCVAALNNGEGITEEKIRSAVRERIRDYQGPDPQAAEKLEKALFVMTEAYLAALLRRGAEKRLEEMLSG